MTPLLAIIFGSVAGGVARYYLTGFVQKSAGGEFPWGTFAVNLAGCFLIGFFASLSQGRFAPDSHSKLLLMTGFCGAFTTFSALIYESDHLMNTGHFLVMTANILLSIIFGFLLFRFGGFLAKVIH